MNMNPTKTEQLRTITRFHLENMGIFVDKETSDAQLVNLVRQMLSLEEESGEQMESPDYLKLSLIKAIAEAGGDSLEAEATSVSKMSEVLQVVLRDAQTK
jgi:hypothetical protein